MTQSDEAIDAMLGAALAPPARPGDRAFLVRVERRIDAEAALARAERRFWKSFAFEALAIGALLASSTVPLIWPLASPKSSASTPLLEPVEAVDWPGSTSPELDRLTAVALSVGVARVTVAGVALLAHVIVPFRFVAPV